MDSKQYTVFDKITGKVLRNISCSDKQVVSNYNPDTEILYNKNCDSTDQFNFDTMEVEKIVLPYPEYPAYHLLDLKSYINDDIALNMAIQNMGENPIEHKKEHYAMFRRWAYPDSNDYLDAQLKGRSNDTAAKAQGKQQLKEYDEACWLVKQRFPKE